MYNRKFSLQTIKKRLKVFFRLDELCEQQIVSDFATQSIN